MENAGLKSQLKERDARIAKLESVLEESRRAGKRQAAPFSKDKPKRDPKKPGRKPGSKYGRQAVRAIPVPDKTFEAPCPEQCPCGGKVGAEGSIDLYQVDIPPIQPETWKFVVGHGHCQECGRRVRGQHPLLISKAFEVGTVHFGPRLLAFAAFQKMICGVSYDKIRLGFEQMLGFPVARSTLCRAMQRLARRAKPTRDALRCGPEAREVVGSGCGSSRTSRLRFRAVVSSMKNYDPRGRRLGPLPLQGSDATELQPSAAPLPRATGDGHARGGALPTLGQGHRPARPRLARSCAMLARSARMACALPRDSSRRDEPPAARPIHQSCQPAIRETSRRYRDNLFVFLDRADVGPPTIPPNKTFASPWSTARPAEVATVPRKGHRPSRSS